MRCSIGGRGRYLLSAIVIRRDTLSRSAASPRNSKRNIGAARTLSAFCWCASAANSCMCRKCWSGTGSGSSTHTTPTGCASRRFEVDSAEAFSEFERRFEGHTVLARLAREHFGARGRKIAALGHRQDRKRAGHSRTDGDARRQSGLRAAMLSRVDSISSADVQDLFPARVGDASRQISQALSPMLAPGCGGACRGRRSPHAGSRAMNRKS